MRGRIAHTMGSNSLSIRILEFFAKTKLVIFQFLWYFWFRTRLAVSQTTFLIRYLSICQFIFPNWLLALFSNWILKKKNPFLNGLLFPILKWTFVSLFSFFFILLLYWFLFIYLNVSIVYLFIMQKAEILKFSLRYFLNPNSKNEYAATQTTDTQRAFFSKIPSFLAWADKLAETFWGIFGLYISSHFSTMSPLSMFSINQPLFL